MKLEFSTESFEKKKAQISSLIKIRAAVAELFHADDMTALIVAFRNLANAVEKCTEHQTLHFSLQVLSKHFSPHDKHLASCGQQCCYGLIKFALFCQVLTTILNSPNLKNQIFI